MEDNEHPMSASFNAKKSKRVSLSVHGNSAPNLHTDPSTPSSANVVDVMDQNTLKLANMRYSQRSMSIARELGMSICRDSMHSHPSLLPLPLSTNEENISPCHPPFDSTRPFIPSAAMLSDGKSIDA